MVVSPDCLPCFLKQAVSALEYAGVEKGRKIEILKSMLDVIKSSEFDKPPAYATTYIYRKIGELTGLDPYVEIKHRYNSLAKSMYDSLKDKVFNSHDPLWTAARLAIAGNIIDFGVFKSIDMEATIERSLADKIEVDHYPLFREEIEKNQRVMILLDNAGEIVFDMLLIEALLNMNKEVTAVVKGSPVINDATMHDAEEIGLTKMCRVIDNGGDGVGTILRLCSDEFKREFETFPVYISKGQGNFETLYGSEKNIFYLFQAKCDVVAKELNLDIGAMLLKR